MITVQLIVAYEHGLGIFSIPLGLVPVRGPDLSQQQHICPLSLGTVPPPQQRHTIIISTVGRGRSGLSPIHSQRYLMVPTLSVPWPAS
jgi:hypothetical protein